LALLLIIVVSLLVFRSNNIDKKEIAWDIFGYYLPLPATFIYDDPMLNDRAWVEKLNEEKQFSGTVYQISSNDEGEPMYFFLFGMSAFYSIFFFIGHQLADWTGYAQDGFSLPYQLSLVYGCMIYTIIGLVYFRKILLTYFSENITCIVLIIVVFGTNYAHHMSLKNLETVNVLFMLAAILIWNTIKWHENQRFKNLLGIGLSLTLMALVKPSEILFILLPLFWNVYDKSSLRRKWTLIKEYKIHVLLIIAICFVVGFPQMLYWYMKSGHWIYDTYKNPGVGLDVFSPHIWNSLFSYRKGWLLYTPIMVIAIIGFYHFRKSNQKIFPAVLITFLISFYIVTCWTEWWYGAGFSNRPVITYYTLLAIPLGYFLTAVSKWKLSFKLLTFSSIILLIFYNQFQWWQMRQYILDPYRTTKEYYWATFLKTTVTEEDRKLLMINRDFSGNDTLSNIEEYKNKVLIVENFNMENGGAFLSPKKEEFGYSQKIPFYKLTENDHVWIKVSFKFKNNNNEGEPVLVALMMERKEGAYSYKTFELENNITEWKEATFYYLTPEIRNTKDILKLDFWKRSPCEVIIDDFVLNVYEKKKS
jgi:hypothetical protein